MTYFTATDLFEIQKVTVKKVFVNNEIRAFAKFGVKATVVGYIDEIDYKVIADYDFCDIEDIDGEYNVHLTNAYDLDGEIDTEKVWDADEIAEITC